MRVGAYHGDKGDGRLPAGNASDKPMWSATQYQKMNDAFTLAMNRALANGCERTPASLPPDHRVVLRRILPASVGIRTNLNFDL